VRRDYYDILGVDRSAGEEDLKKAYRKLARQHHPDTHTGHQEKKAAEETFKEINEAYAVLSDQEKRRRYDLFGHVDGAQGHDGFGPGGFGDIFNDIFEDFFGGRQSGRRVSRGSDLEYTLTLAFEDAVFGKEVNLKIPHWEVCGTCRGSGAKSADHVKICPSCKGAGQLRFQQGFFTINKTCGRCHGSGQTITAVCETCRGERQLRKERVLTVHVPAGVETGTRLRLANEGEPGMNGGQPGDLYVLTKVSPHPTFTRKGDDLLCEVPLSVVAATLGAKLTVPTLKGEGTVLRIPPGTQPDKVFRLKDLGVPSLRGNGTGDQLVRVKVRIPTKLTPKQKELLEEFAKVSGESLEEAEGSGLFDKVKSLFD
jgi:molecular chaperone DnaJ